MLCVSLPLSPGFSTPLLDPSPKASSCGVPSHNHIILLRGVLQWSHVQIPFCMDQTLLPGTCYLSGPQFPLMRDEGEGLLLLRRILHIYGTPLCQRALIVRWKRKEPEGLEEGRDP